MIKKSILGVSLLASTSIFAGGFQLNTQSVKALGMGGSNTAWALDASMAFYNPAALTKLKGHQFTAGFHYVMPSVSLQTDVHDNINQTTPNANPIHFYYSGKITEKISVGFLVNNQFGSSSSFEDDWQGRYIVQNISLRTFMFQPTVAYQIHEKVSVGAGFVYATGAFSFDKAVPVSSDDNVYGKAHLEGKGRAFGGNFGLYVDVFSNDVFDISFGADYRTGLSVELPNGEATFTDIPSSLRETFPEKTAFSGGLNLPSVTTAGLKVGYAINEEIELTAIYDFNYTGWQTYDTLAFDFENPETPDSKTVKNWQNTTTHRVGLDLNINNKVNIRGGVYFDKTPIQDGFLSPELPDVSHSALTVGASWNITEMISVDISFLRQNLEFEADLDAASFSAKYRRQINVVGFGVNVKIPGEKVDEIEETLEEE
jgi:long-chain fatty acid transport protein